MERRSGRTTYSEKSRQTRPVAGILPAAAAVRRAVAERLHHPDHGLGRDDVVLQRGALLQREQRVGHGARSAATARRRGLLGHARHQDDLLGARLQRLREAAAGRERRVRQAVRLAGNGPPRGNATRASGVASGGRIPVATASKKSPSVPAAVRSTAPDEAARPASAGRARARRRTPRGAAPAAPRTAAPRRGRGRRCAGSARGSRAAPGSRRAAPRSAGRAPRAKAAPARWRSRARPPTAGACSRVRPGTASSGDSNASAKRRRRAHERPADRDHGGHRQREHGHRQRRQVRRAQDGGQRLQPREQRGRGGGRHQVEQEAEREQQARQDREHERQQEDAERHREQQERRAQRGAQPVERRPAGLVPEALRAVEPCRPRRPRRTRPRHSRPRSRPRGRSSSRSRRARAGRPRGTRRRRRCP